MKKIVSNQLSPNLTFFDAVHAFFQIPFLFRKKHYDFSPIFGTQNYRMLNAGRTGLGILADILDLDKTKRIGIPAFSCAVMSTPFLERGFQIEWIDTDQHGVLSFEDFEKKSSNLSLVLVPHTFGFRAPLEKIYPVAKQKNIIVVEDCAHLFDISLEHCDAKIFSFGREKIFSCVSGGALVWKDSLKNADLIRSYPLNTEKKSVALRLLFHPLIFSFAIPFWFFGYLGKALVFVLAKIRFLPKAVTDQEKLGKEDFPMRELSPALERILLRQIKKREKIQAHRALLASQWRDLLNDLFPDNELLVPENSFRVFMVTNDAKHILEEAKALGFDFREWDGTPISPKGVLLPAFQYVSGYCPNAENFSQNYVSFPTNKRTTVNDIVRFYSLWKLLQSDTK